MTTTDVFKGMDEEGKPSSRVLRPPGGGSSFTLGGGDDPPPKPTPSGPPKPAVTAAGAPTPDRPAERESCENYRDRLYGGGNTSEVKTKSGGNPKNMGTYNPITGKELVEPKEQKPVHTSTRVRQPPGGASSGIW